MSCISFVYECSLLMSFICLWVFLFDELHFLCLWVFLFDELHLFMSVPFWWVAFVYECSFLMSCISFVYECSFLNMSNRGSFHGQSSRVPGARGHCVGVRQDQQDVVYSYEIVWREGTVSWVSFEGKSTIGVEEGDEQGTAWRRLIGNRRGRSGRWQDRRLSWSYINW